MQYYVPTTRTQCAMMFLLVLFYVSAAACAREEMNLGSFGSMLTWAFYIKELFLSSIHICRKQFWLMIQGTNLTSKNHKIQLLFQKKKKKSGCNIVPINLHLHMEIHFLSVH